MARRHCILLLRDVSAREPIIYFTNTLFTWLGQLVYGQARPAAAPWARCALRCRPHPPPFLTVPCSHPRKDQQSRFELPRCNRDLRENLPCGVPTYVCRSINLRVLCQGPAGKKKAAINSWYDKPTPVGPWRVRFAIFYSWPARDREIDERSSYWGVPHTAKVCLGELLSRWKFSPLELIYRCRASGQSQKLTARVCSTTL